MFSPFCTFVASGMSNTKSSMANINIYIHYDSSTIQITTIRLNVDKFLRWLQNVELYFVANGKLAILLERTASKLDDPLFAAWDVENFMLMT